MNRLIRGLYLLPVFLPAANFYWTAPVHAEAIYSQTIPAEPIGAFGSQDTPSGQKIADSFVIDGAESATVRSIRFVGGYGLRNPPPITPPLDALPTDNLHVFFLDDLNGSPGARIPGGDFAIGPAFRRVGTGGQLLGGVFLPIEYVVNLGSGVELSPSTVYWLVIVNDSDPAHGWVWANAYGRFDQLTAATFSGVASGPWNVYDSGGMFFELMDQIVPEPPSSAHFVTVLLAALIYCRRRLRTIPT